MGPTERRAEVLTGAIVEDSMAGAQQQGMPATSNQVNEREDDTGGRWLQGRHWYLAF